MQVVIDVINGLAVPEGRVLGAVEYLVTELKQGHTVPSIGQLELMNGLRLAVQRGQLAGLEFVMGDQVIPVLPDGCLQYWPKGILGDVGTQLLLDLLL